MLLGEWKHWQKPARWKHLLHSTFSRLGGTAVSLRLSCLIWQILTHFWAQTWSNGHPDTALWNDTGVFTNSVCLTGFKAGSFQQQNKYIPGFTFMKEEFQIWWFDSPLRMVFRRYFSIHYECQHVNAGVWYHMIVIGHDSFHQQQGQNILIFLVYKDNNSSHQSQCEA